VDQNSSKAEPQTGGKPSEQELFEFIKKKIIGPL
jgi:hypothetical protein